jgi:thiamine pyrophosphate-dependent acetolactate synthase large subunit-like protein
LTVGILGDGDALMSINALWTAAKYEIPALMVIANNRSYFNDEIHQQKVAEKRDRNVENRWVGQRIDDPTPDIAQLAKGLGVEAIGPVETLDDLVAAMQQAVAAVRARKPFLVDVVIESNIGREAEVARQEKRK